MEWPLTGPEALVSVEPMRIKEPVLMMLSVQERLMLANVVLPSQGDFVALTLIASLKEKLALTADEINEYEVKDLEGGGVAWNPDKEKDKEIALDDGTKKIIVEVLAGLDKAKTLTPDHMSLYRKFMLPPEGVA
jgi:hypothetical protein